MNNYNSVSLATQPNNPLYYSSSEPAMSTFWVDPVNRESDAPVQQSRFKMPAFITNVMEAISNFFRALFNLSSPKSELFYKSMKLEEERLLGRITAYKRDDVLMLIGNLGFNETVCPNLNLSNSFEFDTNDGYKFKIYGDAKTRQVYLKRIS